MIINVVAGVIKNEEGKIIKKKVFNFLFSIDIICLWW